MSKYGKNGKSNVATGIAIVLALILIAGAVIGLGAHFGGWFDSAEDTEITETEDSSTSSSTSSSTTSSSSEESSSSSSSDSEDSSGTEVLIVE